MHPLTSKQRASLRARAHELNPVVQIGHQGWTDAVASQIDGALTAHELIKIKLGKECPLGTDEVAREIESSSKAQVVQQIGHVVVAFRRNPEKPKIGLKTVDPKEHKADKPGAKAGRQLPRNRKGNRKARRNAKSQRNAKGSKPAGKRRSSVAAERKRPQY
jgi:RNA-binding protein